MTESFKLREQANELFRNGHYGAARHAYRICLRFCPEDSIRILSNLAATYIKLEQWQLALACTQTLRTEPGHLKCLCRAGIANIYLERYKSAVACRQEAFQQDPSDGMVKRFVAEAKERLQQSHGEYDANRLYFSDNPRHWSRYSSYTNPRLSIKYIEGKGRGLVVTGAVEKGDLLAVCRPLAAASKHPIDLEADCCLGCLSRNSRYALRNQLARLAATDADVRKKLNALYDGTQESLQSLPHVRLFQGGQEPPPPQDVVTCNGLADPDPVKVDVDQLSSIIKHNTIETGRQDEDGVSAADPLLLGGDETPEHPLRATVCALYPLLSTVNHSCCPSSCHVVVHDVAFLRASRNLKKDEAQQPTSCEKSLSGDEVTISYHSKLFTTRDKRQAELKNHGWEFDCVCERCQLEAQLPSDVIQYLELVVFLVERPGGILETVWCIPMAEGMYSPPEDVLHIHNTAIQKHSKPGDWPISMQIRGPLACFESSMDRAGLSHTNRRWMQACLLTTYMLLRTCHDWKRDYAAVFQVSQTIGQMHDCVAAGSSKHVIDAVLAVHPLRQASPGSQMHLQLYLECRDPILTRYGPTLDREDRLTYAMKRIDDRMTVIQESNYRSKMTSAINDH